MKMMKILTVFLVFAAFTSVCHALDTASERILKTADVAIINMSLSGVDIKISQDTDHDYAHIPKGGKFTTDDFLLLAEFHIEVVRRINLGLLVITTRAEMTCPAGVKSIIISEFSIADDKGHVSDFYFVH